MTDFIVVIPARYDSSRLPGKPLLDLAGKPMIQHVVEATQLSDAREVVVATDDQRIADAVSNFGDWELTRKDHESGSDRVAEVCRKRGWADEQIIVNIQGDEPDMPPALVRQVAEALANEPRAAMATACVPINDSAEIHDPNVVKVVRNRDQLALMFSRAPIPFQRDDGDPTGAALYRRHLGIYAYRAAYIQTFSSRPACALELHEKLEQLRALWHGDRIVCVDAVETPGIGIDTEADLQRARARLG